MKNKIGKLIDINNNSRLGKFDVAMTRQYFEYDSFRQQRNMAIMLVISIIIGICIVGYFIGVDRFKYIRDTTLDFKHFDRDYIFILVGMFIFSLINLDSKIGDYYLYRLNYGDKKVGDKKCQ